MICMLLFVSIVFPEAPCPKVHWNKWNSALGTPILHQSNSSECNGVARRRNRTINVCFALFRVMELFPPIFFSFEPSSSPRPRHRAPHNSNDFVCFDCVPACHLPQTLLKRMENDSCVTIYHDMYVFRLFRLYFWWPRLQKTIETYERWYGF